MAASWKQHKYSPTGRCIKKDVGFPGGAVVENLPANAGDTGSSPGLGRSHMPRSNWAHEPQLLSLRIWSLFSARTEAAIMRGPRTAMKSGPHSPQLEKALAQKRRPNTAKKNKKINLKSSYQNSKKKKKRYIHAMEHDRTVKINDLTLHISTEMTHKQTLKG